MKELELLHSIGKLMTSLLDLDKLLTRIVEASVDITGAEEGYLLLVDEKTGELYLRAGRNLGEEHAQGFRLKVHDSIAGSVVKTGKSMMVTSKEERGLTIKTGYIVKSLLNVPLKVREKVIGILGVNNKVSDKAFSEDNLYMLSILADYAAIAIENAQLFDHAQQRVGNLETLQDLALTISSSLDLDEALRKACQAAVEFFSADHSGLVLFDPSYVEGKVRAEYPALGTLGMTIPLRGVPAEERLIETKEPLIISDIAGDESLGPVRDILGKFDIRSILIAPVVFKGQVLGSFSLDATGRLRTFTENEVDLCKIFAAQVAVAIENAKLYRDMERQAERLTVLHEIGREMVSALELDRILGSIGEHIARLVGARKSLFLLVDKKRGCLIKATGYGYPPEHLQKLTFEEVEAGVSGWVLRTGKPTLVADAQSDPRNTGIALEKAKQFDTVPLIVAPLVVKGEVIGTLTAVNTGDDPPFTEGDLNTVGMLANRAAIAIENARLYEREQRRAREAEAMVRVGQAISSTLDLDRILEIVAQSALPLLKLEDGRSTIFLVDEKTGDFVRATRVPPREDGNGPRQSGGLSKLVIEMGEPIVIPDVRRDSRVRPSVTEEGVRSLIGVPLKVKERTIGVLFANTLCPHDFTQRDIEMLSSLANQAAVAIENARLFSQLSETKERLNSLIASSLDAVIAIDQDRKITVFNRQAEEMFGWTAEEMKGRNVARLHVDLSKARQIHAVVNREENIPAWEITLKYKDGTAIPALLSAHLIRDSQGRPIGQAGFIRDLREVKVLEDRLRSLMQVSRGITGTLELDEVLDLIVESAVAFFPAAQKGSIHLYDEKTGMLHIKASHGYSPEVVKALTLKVGEGRAGWVYEHATPLVVGNVQEDERSRKIDREIKHPEVQEQKSAICVPLPVEDRVIGTLSLDNVITFDAFKAEDLELLSIFAGQAAVAIMNAELMTKNRERLRRLEMLSWASNEMMSDLHSLSFDDRLHLIVRHAAQILNAEAGSILLVKRPGFLTKEACYGHLESDFQKGREFAIISGRKTGLTGHIAYTGELFNAHGDDLVGHWAVAGREPTHVASGKCHSLLAIPLKRRVDNGEQLIGLLQVENKKDEDGQPKRYMGFTEEDEWILSIFAETVVICLENAELYERTSDRLEEKVVRLQALYDAGRTITASLDLDAILNEIVRQAQRLTGKRGKEAYFGDILLVDGGKLKLVSAFPAGVMDDLRSRFGSHIGLEKGVNGRIGITGRAVRTGESQLVGDVILDPDFYEVCSEQTRSELAVPIKIGGEVIGVINVEHPDYNAFDKDDQRDLESLATQAAIAIQNARQYEELKRIKGLVGARTALAWMGMASGAWRHAVDKHALTIQEQSQLLYRDLIKICPREQHARMAERLSMIERLASQILRKPITTPLSAEWGVESVAVNDLISERARQLWQNEPYRRAKLRLDLRLDKKATVRASPEWLRRAIDMVVDNAVDAVTDREVREIVIGTRPTDGGAEIWVSDTGPGIPKEIRLRVGRELVGKSEGVKGLGMGLLMTHAIAEAYGGEIRIDATGPTGTTIVIWLPLEETRA